MSGGDIEMSLLLAGRWCNIDRDECRTQEKGVNVTAAEDQSRTAIDSARFQAQLAPD